MSFLLDLWFMLPAPIKWVIIAAFAYFAATVLLGSLLPIILLAVTLGGLLYVGLAAKSGAVALSGMLGHIVRALTNSAPASANSPIAQPSTQFAPPQPPPQPAITRREAYELGSQAINALHGNDEAKRQLDALVNVAEVAAKRGEKGLGLTAPLHLILLHGPSGTGKSKVAEALPALLYGVGALPNTRPYSLLDAISGTLEFLEQASLRKRRQSSRAVAS